MFYSASVFDVPILPFAMLVPRLPIFWALLQKNGPKFDVTPELLGGFRGTILCRIFFDLGKRMCQRAYFAIFSCKTAQKFRRPHCGRLNFPLVSLPLLRKPPPSRARVRSLRFARLAPARLFPPKPLALASFARPRDSSHGYIRSNPQFIVLSPSSGFVARCRG